MCAGCFLASIAGASEAPGAGAFLVGIRLEQTNSDRLSVGDIRPQGRGEWGGGVSLDYQFAERWAANLTGHIGGSWFDFNGFAVSGKIVDANWAVRAGVDRLIPLAGGSALLFGTGFEYGEARSWLDNLTISQQGPHNYLVGGSARVGISSPPCGRLMLYGEALQTFYKAHASDGASGTKYNWLGRSFTGAIGMRFILGRGRPSQ